MNAVTNHLPLPIVRKDLNFRLEEVPRFWFDNDPFRTRIFDALSLTFPDGERYFIQCVRLFQDQIQDPELANRVKDFIRQEAQHGISHDKMNKILIDQGMPIEKYIRQVNQRFKHALKRYPNTFNIAITASCEHLTALMATTFLVKKVPCKAHILLCAHFLLGTVLKRWNTVMSLLTSWSMLLERQTQSATQF